MAAAAFVCMVHLPGSHHDELAARLLHGLADGHAARIRRRARAIDCARGAVGQLAVMAAATAALHGEGVDVNTAKPLGERAVSLDVERDQSGRPRVVVTATAHAPPAAAPPAAAADASLAHHGSWVLAAAAGGEGSRVGVDVVYLGAVPLPGAAARIARHFSADEAEQLTRAAGGDSPPEAHSRLFAAMWAYKEASWKASSRVDGLRGGEEAASPAATPTSSPLRGIALPPALAAAVGAWAAGGETTALDVTTAVVVDVHSGVPAATIRVSMLWLLDGEHVAALVVECPSARLPVGIVPVLNNAAGFEAWEPSVPELVCGGVQAVRLQGARVVVGAQFLSEEAQQNTHSNRAKQPPKT
jgi:hypothetical protein